MERRSQLSLKPRLLTHIQQYLLNSNYTKDTIPNTEDTEMGEKQSLSSGFLQLNCRDRMGHLKINTATV